MTTDTYIKNLSNFIKSLIANNPYAQSLTKEDKQYLREYMKDWKIMAERKNIGFSSPAINPSIYNKIAYGIFMDQYCDFQITEYWKGTPTNFTFPAREIIESDFETLFDALINNWCKFLYPENSSESGNDTIEDIQTTAKEIFDKIYARYPVICAKLLPVVVFLIADNYSDLRKKNSLSKKRQSELLCYFEKLFLEPSIPYYLCSILNCKSQHYPGSSQDEGYRIFERILDKYEEAYSDHVDSDSEYSGLLLYDNDTSKFYSSLLFAISRIFSQDATAKRKERMKIQDKAGGSSYLPLGENIIAFIMLLKKTKDLKDNGSNNSLSYCDIPVSLYCFNKITGLIGLLLTYQSTHIGIGSYPMIYHHFTKLATLKTFLDYISSIPDSDTQGGNQNLFLSGEFQSLLTDIAKLDDEIRSNYFTQCIDNVNVIKKKQFISQLDSTYEEIISQLFQTLPGNKKANWFEVPQLSKVLLSCIAAFTKEDFHDDPD
jgi:hypothetical protein